VILAPAAVALLAVGHFVGIRLMADWRVMESLLAPGGQTDLAPLALALAFLAVRMAALFLGPGLVILALILAAGRLAAGFGEPRERASR
jgi:hypothetical protein